MNIRTYIDGNSVGHAAQHGLTARGKKLVAGGQETTAIYGMLVSLHKLLRDRPFTKPVVLWDGRSWRYERFPEYKGNRLDTAEKVAERERYRSQRAEMFRGLHLLGVPQIIARNMEADDLAAILTRRALGKSESVLLVTGDKDWLQLVERGVVWQDHKIERTCSESTFHHFTGFKTQRAFIDAKALQGDAGDNVKPNTGVGESGAKNLLAVFDDVDHFLRTNLDEAQDRYFLHHGKKMHHGTVKFHSDPEAQARFRWALELMDLSHPSIPAPENMRVTKAPLDRDAFTVFCGQHGFISLVKDMDNFLTPFLTSDEEIV
jgi:5'-3' exonuclease